MTENNRLIDSSNSAVWSLDSITPRADVPFAVTPITNLTGYQRRHLRGL